MFWFPSKNMGGDTLESISKYRTKGAPLFPAFSSKHDGLTNLTCINVKMWDYRHLPLFSSQKKKKNTKGMGRWLSLYSSSHRSVGPEFKSSLYPYKSQTWWHMPIIPVQGRQRQNIPELTG